MCAIRDPLQGQSCIHEPTLGILQKEGLGRPLSDLYRCRFQNQTLSANLQSLSVPRVHGADYGLLKYHAAYAKFFLYHLQNQPLRRSVCGDSGPVLRVAQPAGPPQDRAAAAGEADSGVRVYLITSLPSVTPPFESIYHLSLFLTTEVSE